MDGLNDLLFLGAEAEIRRAEFLQLPAVSKRRIPKSYRHRSLDDRIRKERTRLEAQILADAGRAGLPVPRVFDVDLPNSALILEEIPGPSLRVRIESDASDCADLCEALGRIIARLHTAGLIHGDLTTSNVLVGPRGPVLVDFGLAQWSHELENRAVDLLLVERTFESSHPGRRGLHQRVLRGYQAAFPDWKPVFDRVEEIKARGRYT